MACVTLQDLFAELDGQRFENREALEVAVLGVFNSHLGELPIGYTYHDAIEGARTEGWLRTNGSPHGVRVVLGASAPAAA